MELHAAAFPNRSQLDVLLVSLNPGPNIVEADILQRAGHSCIKYH